MINYEVLNNTLEHFESFFTGKSGTLSSPALRLFGIIILIDLILSILLNLGEVDNIKLLIKKILKYGIVYFIILNYSYITKVVIDGFRWVGLTAGSNAITAEIFGNPTILTENGFRVTSGIFDKAANIVTIVSNPVLSGQYWLTGFLILLCFFSLAINFVVTYLEFYIISLLSLILIPFGANKYTSFIAQKVVNTLFSLGVKIMVLAFITSAAIPLVEQWNLPNNFGIENVFYLLLGSLALAFLSWHAPNLASSLMSGMPSLNASSIISPAISTANSAVVTAATMGAGAPAAIAAAGGSSAGSAVKAATKTTS